MNGAGRPNRTRWMIGALIASLALNAFLIGVLATDLVRSSGRHGKQGSRALSFELRWLEGRLPPEGLDRVAAAVAAARPDAELRIARLKELRQGLGELASVPQPDRAAIDARLQEIRAELAMMVANSQKVAMDALLALPPETRSRLADEVDTSR
jgi:uncharacterized membrane protein